MLLNPDTNGGGGSQTLCHVTLHYVNMHMINGYFYDGSELIEISSASAVNDNLEFDMPPGFFCMYCSYQNGAPGVTAGDGERVVVSPQGGQPINVVACYCITGNCTIG